MDILEVYDWECKHPNEATQLMLSLAVTTTKELGARLEELKITSMEEAYEELVKIPMQDPDRVEIGLNKHGDIEFIPSDFKKISFTYDEICSKLESYKIVLSQQMEHCASEQRFVSAAAEAMKKISNLTERITQVNADTYYLAEYFYIKMKELESAHDLIQAVNILRDSLFFEGALETVRYEVELTLDRGAIVVPKVQTDSAYLNIDLTTRHIYTYEYEDSKPALQAKADYINSNCRIFKCNNCGAITYERLADDKQKLELGLQPHKCCMNCRLIDKTNFFREE